MTTRHSRRPPGVAIAVIVAAVFMANLDLWIVNVALVDMEHGFHGSLPEVSWVLNAYAVTLAALLIPAGRIGDRIGHRPVFLAGIAVFTLASLACAAAPDIAVLVVARVVQAAGAAAQLPTSLALLMAAVPEERRMPAARAWSVVGALAAISGPVLGGVLVSLSWRWVFVVNLPVGALAWFVGRRVLRPAVDRRPEPMPDLLGSALLIIALGALTAALVQAPSWHWVSGGTVGLLVLFVLTFAGFVQRCRTHPFPMVELPLLRVSRFASANAATFLFSISFAIMLLSNSLWCQDMWHYSPLRTGLAMVPGPAMVPVVTFASGRLVRRAGPGPVAALGSLLFAVALLWRVVSAGASPDYLHDLLPSMLIGGTGTGLALSTLVAAGATALPGHRSATGSAIVNSGRQIASALGTALLVTVLGTAATSRYGYAVGWVAGAGLALLAGGISLALPRPASTPLATVAAGTPHREAGPLVAADLE